MNLIRFGSLLLVCSLRIRNGLAKMQTVTQLNAKINIPLHISIQYHIIIYSISDFLIVFVFSCCRNELLLTNRRAFWRENQSHTSTVGHRNFSGSSQLSGKPWNHVYAIACSNFNLKTKTMFYNCDGINADNMIPFLVFAVKKKRLHQCFQFI